LGATFQVRLSALAFSLKKKKELKQLLQSFAQKYLPTKYLIQKSNNCLITKSKMHVFYAAT
jgi:hypothetical protein